MVDVPGWVYEPVELRVQVSEGELSSDLELDNVPDGVRPDELTASGAIPKHQHVRKRSWIACFAVQGTATVWLDDGACTVYRVLYDAFYETETWWLRVPPVVIERTSEWRSQWWRYLEVCADGSVAWLPGEEWTFGERRLVTGDGPGWISAPGAPRPTVLPPPVTVPDEIMRSRSTHSLREGGVEILLHRDLIWKRVSAPKRIGCHVTTVYEVVIRVSRFEIPNGPELVIRIEHRAPPQLETVVTQIPGCVEDAASSPREEGRE
jgi:hypothetical protein